MTAFKQFSTKDVTVNPFLANKKFDFSGDTILTSDVSIDIFQGINPVGDTGTRFSTPTGLISTQNTTGIYYSIRQLYYSNYLTSSLGDINTTASVLSGVTPGDDTYFGQVQGPRYDNYLQSSLTQSRYFPTGSGNVDGDISVVSIPQKLFGENIVPYTFEMSYTTSANIGYKVIDDGEGNLILNSITPTIPTGEAVNDVVGQVFYSHGMAIFTTSSLTQMATEIKASVSQLADFDITFSSSISIIEHQYKCMISENEFGYSLNPSLISSSLGISQSNNQTYYDFATGSVFDPYITTVGLYNEAIDLIAVGKLSYPVPVSKFCDTTILINFDT
jgi:hypothetical protein